MATCEACGFSVECPRGCGFFCTSDCTDCTRWCEPTTVEAAVPDFDSVPTGAVRTITSPGDKTTRSWTGREIVETTGSLPRYGVEAELDICIKDVPLARLARMLGFIVTTPLQATEQSAPERVSLTMKAPIAEVLAKLGLRAGSET